MTDKADVSKVAQRIAEAALPERSGVGYNRPENLRQLVARFTPILIEHMAPLQEEVERLKRSDESLRELHAVPEKASEPPRAGAETWTMPTLLVDSAPRESEPPPKDALEEIHEAWAAEAEAAQAAVSHEAVEAYIASLSWDWASAEARTLVAGNIRAFGAKIRAALEAAFESATALPPAPSDEPPVERKHVCTYECAGNYCDAPPLPEPPVEKGETPTCDGCVDLRQRKDDAYTERNRLVAILAALFPASLERHPEGDKDWEDDWRWVVFINTPAGQLSWHLHDSHVPLFNHVPRFRGTKWDGHTTPEKYARLERLIAIRFGNAPAPEEPPQPMGGEDKR